MAESGRLAGIKKAAEEVNKVNMEHEREVQALLE
jgi:hypothetical protein